MADRGDEVADFVTAWLAHTMSEHCAVRTPEYLLVTLLESDAALLGFDRAELVAHCGNLTELIRSEKNARFG